MLNILDSVENVKYSRICRKCKIFQNLQKIKNALEVTEAVGESREVWFDLDGTGCSPGRVLASSTKGNYLK